jgi:hypothetical protein
MLVVELGGLDAGNGIRLAFDLDRVSAIAPDLASFSRSPRAYWRYLFGG